MPFNIDTTAGYTVAYIFQTTAGLFTLLHVTFMETTGFLSINQIALHINILIIKYSKLGKNRMKYGSEESFQTAMKINLNAFIFEHQDVIK